MEQRIIIAGSGGQGVLFFGKLLAHAAMTEDHEITWFPSYGAEMRGGTANCTVVIADRQIGSPVIRNPGILVVMNEASYERFAARLVPGGVLLGDAAVLLPRTHRQDIRIIAAPASEIAAARGVPDLANMVMLGALVAATGVVDAGSAVRAVDACTSARKRERLDLNKDLLMQGYGSLCRKADAGSAGGPA